MQKLPESPNREYVQRMRKKKEPSGQNKELLSLFGSRRRRLNTL